MKKIILSAIAIFTIGFANAQKAEFGLKGGLNIANQNYSGYESPSPSSIIGFNVGGFVDIKISDKFSIQPELVYSTQGSEFSQNISYEGDDYNTKNTFKLAYINIPVMARYYVAEKFNLEAGPQIGFLVDSKLKTEVLGQSVSQDAKDIFESLDFGFNLGAGYDFTNKIFAGIRYNFGLTNVLKTESDDDSKIKNNVLSLSVGYKF